MPESFCQFRGVFRVCFCSSRVEVRRMGYCADLLGDYWGKDLASGGLICMEKDETDMGVCGWFTGGSVR